MARRDVLEYLLTQPAFWRELCDHVEIVVTALNSNGKARPGLLDRRTMASWLERGRPAIFEALATVCDQIDNDLQAGGYSGC